MGVDFYTCKLCHETFPDCGPYYICDGCEGLLCFDCGEEMIKQYGFPDPDSDDCSILDCREHQPRLCYYCDPAKVNDNDMLEYLIKQSGKTKDEIRADILEDRNQG